MQSENTKNFTLNQLFEPIFNKNFSQHLLDLKVGKYVKKLITMHLIKLLTLAQLERQRGLRDISNSLNNENLSQAINLESISVVEEENALNVYDCAYVDYKRADCCCKNNIRFVSRLKRNALVTVIEDHSVKSGNKLIVGKRSENSYVGDNKSTITSNFLSIS